MSVNTQTSSDHDEHVNAQETEAIRAASTAAENEVFLRDTFGIFLPENIQPADIAEKVAHRVSLVVDQTRNNINRGELENLLNRNLQDRINAARATSKEAGTLATATDTQRNRNIRAVVEAIRESVPTAAMNDVLRYGMPAVISEKQDIPPHHISIDCDIGGKKSQVVRIDTRHSFWRENEYPNTNDLRDALKDQRSLAAVGISVVGPPPLAESYTLTDTDIDNILSAKSSVVDLSRRYDNFTKSINIAGNPVNFHINFQGLLRYRDSFGNLVASYIGSTTDLLDLLKNDEDVWNFISMEPMVEPLPTFVYTMLVNRIYNAAGTKPGSTDALALEERSVADLQKEVAEQHRFHTTLREGSDNQMGATFASSILMKYKDIRSVLESGDQTKAKESLDTERAKQSLLKSISDAEGFNFNPSRDWALAEAQVSPTALGSALADCAVGSVTPPNLGGVAYTKPVTTKSEESSARSWVQIQYKEAQEAEVECRKMLRHLTNIARDTKKAGGTTPLKIFDYINEATLTFVGTKSDIKKDFDLASIIKDIHDNGDFDLKTEDEHKKKADEYKAELEKIQKGEMPKGAEAQHLVIKEYMKRYHGLTDSEASSAANVIRGRSLIDTEMSTAIKEISGEIYGDVDDNAADAEVNQIRVFRRGGKRDLLRIAEIAKASRIPVGENNIPNWSAGSYKNLMGAYFALRQMNDGTDVPWMMRLNSSHAAKKQMREITAAILKKHAKAMLQEFGASVGLSDDKQKEVLKDPTKPEHQAILIQILEGEVPENQKAQVQKVLNTADKKLFRMRRGVGYVTGSLIYGDKNPVSAKNLLYGNKYVSALGATKGVKNVAVGTVGGVWNNKATIAKIGALTAIGGPLGLAIGTAVWGGDFGKNKTSLAA